jgi:hypothetical protein
MSSIRNRGRKVPKAVVDAILSMNGSARDVAEATGVGRTTVCRIRRGDFNFGPLPERPRRGEIKRPHPRHNGIKPPAKALRRLSDSQRSAVTAALGKGGALSAVLRLVGVDQIANAVLMSDVVETSADHTDHVITVRVFKPAP